MVAKIQKFFIKLGYIFIDIFFLFASIYIACKIRQAGFYFDVNFYNLFFGEVNPFRYVFLFWIIISLVSLWGQSLYETRREFLEGFEINKIIKSIAISFIILAVSMYVLKIQDFPRAVFFISIVLNFLFLTAWRIVKRYFVESLVASGYNNFNVLIIGAGRVGRTLCREIQRRPGLGLRVVGFLDDYKTETTLKNTPPVLGKIRDLKVIAPREFVSNIFVTVYPHENEAFVELLSTARELGIAIRVVPQGFEWITGEFVNYNIGIIPILEYSEARNFKRNFGKRIFDLFAATFLMILLIPVFVVLGICVKIDSPGPVFYFSYRYGRGGKKFYMWKFRSMVPDAEVQMEQIRYQNEVDGPIFKIRKDPRITRLGRFLRKYSLDELPQLFNVIKGDMSLVGPRPFVVGEVQREDLKQLRRLEVKPGITGLWQIRGRNDVSFYRLVRWDMWYIDNWSFWLDMYILFKTFPVVVRGKGAY